MKLADDGFVAGWSPEGAFIAFTRLQEDQTGCPTIPAGCFQTIFVVRADGTREPTELADGSAPTWAPTTDRLLFYTLTRGEAAARGTDTYPVIVGRDVYVADLASRRTVALARNQSGEPVSAGDRPSWSPDGNQVLFGWGERDRHSLYVIEADGAEPPVKIANGSTFEANWAPDSQRIVYSWEGEIYTVSADGSSPPRRLAAGHQPYWSPTGSRIAFGARTDAGGEVWLLDPETGEGTKLAEGWLLSASPASVWSPDGTRVIYSAERSIFVVAADASSPPVKIAEGSHPTWSPDGTRIAFLKRAEREGGGPGLAKLFVINADGTNPTMVADELLPCFNHAWSPDGQRLAFSSVICALL